MSWVNMNWCSKDYTLSSEYQQIKTARDNHTKNLKNKFTSNDIDIVIYPTIRSKLSTISSSKTTSTKTAAYTITASGFPSMNIQIGSINGLYYGMEMVTTPNNESVLYSTGYLYQNKTNYYKNPSISRNLYSISEELSKIKKIYEQNEKNDKYKHINLITKEYLENYSASTKSHIKESFILSIYNLMK
jgi:hypothetical protein